jgi:hypothetical protein
MSAITQTGGEQYAFRPREEVKRIDDMFPRAAASGLREITSPSADHDFSDHKV